jgi:tetratricopeptide (TPR) repeat protein
MRSFSAERQGSNIHLLIHLILIVVLSLGLLGCDQEKTLGQIFSLKGQILESLGYHQKALQAFNQALKHDPQQARTYAGRGLAHFYLNHLDEAIADYNRALKLNPKLAGTYLNRGYAYLKKGRYDQALADDNRAIELDPHKALYYNNRGEAYRHKGMPAKAMADYNRALELDPDLAMAYNNRGLIYFVQGKTDQALVEYNRSLQADPKYVLAYKNRTQLYYRIKQYDLAWRDLQKVQSLEGTAEPQFIGKMQEALARERQAPGGPLPEKQPPPRRSVKEKLARLNVTLNRGLGVAGLVLWGYLLLCHLFWKTMGRRFLKKPIKIPAEFGLERKEEYLAGRRATNQTLLKHLELISKGLWFPIVLSCLWISIPAALGWASLKQVNFEGLLLAGLLIPGYRVNRMVIMLTKDTLQQLEGGECVVQTSTWPAGLPFWLINVLPPLALIPLFYRIPWPDLAQRLGFGLGVALAVILLSVMFIRTKATIGIWVNIILLNFVYLAYYLPGLDKIEHLKKVPFREFLPVVGLPLVVIFAASHLVSYTLIKKRGVSVSPHFFRLQPARGSLQIAFLAPIAGALAQKYKILPFSWTFIGVQALAWLWVLITLLIKEYRGKVDFREIREYIVKEKGLRINLNLSTALVYLVLFLAACTLCESFRGLWWLWAGSILWLGLILVCLWKVWRYAWVDA